MALEGKRNIEILVHVSAPSRGPDDARYRALVAGYLAFEPSTGPSIDDGPAAGNVHVPDENTETQLHHNPWLSSSATEESPIRDRPSQRRNSGDDSYQTSESDYQSPVRKCCLTRSLSDRRSTIESPDVSFNSILDNVDSPAFYCSPQNGTSVHGSQIIQLSDSWEAPPNEVLDSQPTYSQAIPQLSSPGRVLESWLQQFDSCSDEFSTPEPRSSDPDHVFTGVFIPTGSPAPILPAILRKTCDSQVDSSRSLPVEKKSDHPQVDNSDEQTLTLPLPSLKLEKRLLEVQVPRSRESDYIVGCSQAVLSSQQNSPCPPRNGPQTRSQSGPSQIMNRRTQVVLQAERARTTPPSISLATEDKKRKRSSASNLERSTSRIKETPITKVASTSRPGIRLSVSVHSAMEFNKEKSMLNEAQIARPEAPSLPNPKRPKTELPPAKDPFEIHPPRPATSMVELVPAGPAIVTPSLANLIKQEILRKAYQPISQTRPLRPLERGYWSLDVSFWPLDLRERMWRYLALFIGKGKAGWGVWCSRHDLTRSEVGETPVAGHGEWRTYCWGEIVSYVLMLLYLASEKKVKGAGAQWVDAEGKVVIVTRKRD